MNFFLILIEIIAIFLILRWPYLGVVLIGASLPVQDLVPVIGDISIVLPVVAAISLIGYLLNYRIGRKKRLFQLSNVHAIGLLFIFYIYITNPQAAWFGPSRNWVTTFLQLWLLMLLASVMLDTPENQHTFFLVFSIASTISAYVAIRQGYWQGIFIKEAFGLAEGSNIAARYFTVSFVFLNYLRAQYNRPFVKILLSLGTVVTFIGVFITVSRTGIMLLFAAIAAIFLSQKRLSFRFQLVILSVVSLIVLWSLSNRVLPLISGIAPTVSQGGDTMGLRYKLWQAGWRMFVDQPVFGVGIGMFPDRLINYGSDILPAVHLNLVAHNMYIQIAAETGFFGFFIFILLLGVSAANFFKPKDLGDERYNSLRNTWRIAFILMLIGGITMSIYADKLIWLIMGVSGVFRQSAAARFEEQKEIALSSDYLPTRTSG